LTFKKGIIHNKAALQNSPWGAYEPEKAWESAVPGPQSSSNDLKKGKSHPARGYLQLYDQDSPQM